MSEPPFAIRAYRFVHGKVVTEPGGPVTPGFEHRATSVSRGLPEALLGSCRPQQILGNRSVQALVHPLRERDGAIFFWPASTGGKRWMLATCARARPESGEGGLSRTHTQLVTLVFREQDWREHAPRLIANAPRWLKADPDTLAFHEAHLEQGDYPLQELTAEQLPEIPRCQEGPLPRPGTLLWRLAAGLENGSGPLICGRADRLDSVDIFLRALACAVALLPKALRIYLTAAAGFAEIEETFAIQHLPDAPPLGPAEPGLLEQSARQLLAKDPEAEHGHWQAFWNSALNGPDQELAQSLHDIADPIAWRQPAEARVRLPKMLDELNAVRSLAELKDWLDDRRPDPPPPPTFRHPETRKGWIEVLTDRLDRVIEGQGEICAARPLSQLAALVDPNPATPEIEKDQASDWRSAWRAAAHKAQSPRQVLRWSTLALSRRIDDRRNAEPRELGRFQNFAELRAVMDALGRAKRESRRESLVVEGLIKSPAFVRRLSSLRRRANRLLVQDPESICDLGAAKPELLRPHGGEDRETSRRLARTVFLILAGTRLEALCGERPPTWHRSHLAEAAQAVARESYQVEQKDDLALRDDLLANSEEYLRDLFERFLSWAAAPGADTDPSRSFWGGSVVDELALLGRSLGIGKAVQTLVAVARRLDEEQTAGGETFKAAGQIFRRGLEAASLTEPRPERRAAELIGALPSLDYLVAQRHSRPLMRRLVEAIYGQLHTCARESNAPGLISDLLPALARVIGDYLRDAGRSVPPTLGKQMASFCGNALKRVLLSPHPLPREPTVGLIGDLDALLQRCSGVLSNFDDEAYFLSEILARCALAWSAQDPPEPWLDPAWFESDDWPKDSPIRMRLARRLGYPRCAYFAAVAPASPQTIQVLGATRYPTATHIRLNLDRTLAPLIERVIAYGAGRTWHRLFYGSKEARTRLARLLEADSSADAFLAIEALVQARPPLDASLLDPETRYAVVFLAGLGASRPASPPAMPLALRAALLEGQHSPYASYVAQAIAGSNGNLGKHLREMFSGNRADDAISRRVVLPGEQGGWCEFYQRDEETQIAGLLRIMFLLSLVLCPDQVHRAKDKRITFDRRRVSAALSLERARNPVKTAMNALFNRKPDIAEAFRRALKHANLDIPPGWPDAPDRRTGG